MDPFLAALEPPLYKAIREGNTTLFNELVTQPNHRANLYQDGRVCSGFNLMSTAIPSGQIEIARKLFALDAFDFNSKFPPLLIILMLHLERVQPVLIPMVLRQA